MKETIGSWSPCYNRSSKTTKEPGSIGKIYNKNNLPSAIRSPRVLDILIQKKYDEPIETFFSHCAVINKCTMEEYKGKLLNHIKDIHVLKNILVHDNKDFYIFFEEEIKKVSINLHNNSELDDFFKNTLSELYNYTLPPRKTEKEKIISTIEENKRSVGGLLKQDKPLFDQLIAKIENRGINQKHVIFSKVRKTRQESLKFLDDLYKVNKDYFLENVSFSQNSIYIDEKIYKILEMYVSGLLEKKMKSDLENKNITIDELMNKYKRNPSIIRIDKKIILGRVTENFSINDAM
ncbi:MAG: hypothetical protein GY828_02130 [Candidatus Gracilibacteria bacterium]|nr:hypothetical protein [Candidatus Gracilibacteria bacterium]